MNQPTKAKFEYMSDNEWLGDATTHFMKSGESLRSPENHSLDEIAKMIPRVANGVKVEYDISYDMPGDVIHGYKITDLLTKCVQINPQNSMLARQNVAAVVGWGPTDEGIRIMAALKESITDKYIQSNDEACESMPSFKDLIILPGTNILIKEDAVDFAKIDQMVKEGALVKLHPITSKVWQTMLHKRWGKSCIPADAPLYTFLRECERAHFTMSSETGLAAVILGKKIGLIAGKKSHNPNFESLYRGLDSCKEPLTMTQKVTALFSHPQSGIISVYHQNQQGMIAEYFEHCARNFKHKKPTT